MSDPFVRHTKICQGRGEDPFFYLTKLYTQFLQGLFNFMEDGHFHWEPDDEVSEIIIRAEAPLDLQTVGKKPALTVLLGPAQFSGLGLDNMIEHKLSTGRKVRTDLMTGHLIVYSLAENDILALRLAHIVAHHTRVHQRILESRGGFHQIARPFPTVNSPSPPGTLVVGDPEGLVMVQVNIPYQFQWTWATDPKQSPQLRSLDMITQSRRASEFPFTSPKRLERVELAMSTAPVFVQRISGPHAGRPTAVAVTEAIKPFQLSGLRPFGDEESS